MSSPILSPRPPGHIVPTDVPPAPAPAVGRDGPLSPAPSAFVPASEMVVLSHGSTFLVLGADGAMGARPHDGLYSADTRFVSGHEVRINGRPLSCIGAARLSYRRARWTYGSPRVCAPDGGHAASDTTVSVECSVGQDRLHEDVVVRCYGPDPVSALLSLSVESDFADVFEVRSERWQVRGDLTSTWSPEERFLETRYARGDFSRRTLVRVDAGSVPVTYAAGRLRFPFVVHPATEWRLCLEYDLRTDATRPPPLEGCPLAPGASDPEERQRTRWSRTAARAASGDPRLHRACAQAAEDLAALRLHDRDFAPDVWLPAAGVPWFVAVFGRDSIIASLQAMPLHPLFAIGTLQKLAQWQATVDDPIRDAEPGKICHEMRVGEWSHFGTVPHSPYYGTAEATPLYLILLGETFRWLGDVDLLEPFRPTAERCLDWIDRHGDLDGDGLQEYRPRSPAGYRNHCWRDADDGVLDETGGFPRHPIGTCDLDAYVYAAKLGVVDLVTAWGDAPRARRLRDEARALRDRHLEAYWVEEDATLALARDGSKRRVRTATSLPGHALWLGILDRAHAAAVADRLLQPDLFSGWGLRTLSSAHPSYDPHSYQRGSVWPHDTMIAAAGMARYGLHEGAWRLIDGVLGAVSAFERTQVPELFAGLPRTGADAPVPYARSNVPQAWAAGAVFQAVRVLLGLEPDVPAGTVHVDPVLPPWCPTLRLENVRIGGQRFSFDAVRDGDGRCRVDVDASPGPLEIVRGRRGGEQP